MSGTSSLQELLWDQYIDLLHIKRRFYVLDAFQTDLHKVTQGVPFRIRNDIAWNMMLDLRDKLIIDLASWAMGARACGQRGLFDRLRNHCSEMIRTRPARPGDDPYQAAEVARHREKRFKWLFPDCAADSPTKADIEKLRERFRLKSAELREDRNKNRAHVYEGTNLTNLGNAKMLSVEEAGELFEFYEEVVEGISLVSAGNSFGGDDLNLAGSADTAADMVDLVLLGGIDEYRRIVGDHDRMRVYALLHERHVKQGPDSEDGCEFFNDQQYDPAVYAELQA